MNMTLFCDASVCNRTGAAGWGAWVKRNDWERGRTFGAMFNSRHATAVEAELAGIATAVGLCRTEKLLDGVNVLMIQSDCMHALSMIAGFVPGVGISNTAEAAQVTRAKPTAKRTASDALSLMKLSTIVAETGLIVTVRHVRGHKDGPGRPWVNRQCDAEARKHMQRARNQAETEMRL